METEPTPRRTSKMAVVLETFPGDNGLVRKAKIKTANANSLQLSAKNLVKTLKHRILHDKLLVLAKSQSFWLVFHKIPYLMKTLTHVSLHEKILVPGKSTSFNGFSQNAILFASFC